MNESLEFWPNAQDRLLLTTALFDGDKARTAWDMWLANFVAVDAESLTLFPLVYRNLQKLGIEQQAPAIMRDAYRQTWFRNQKVFALARRAVKTLHEAGIDTILLKGAILMHRHYQDYRLRPMHDVDVLVPLHAVPQAIELLANLGLKLTIPLPAQRIPLIHGTTFRQDNAVDFDLHWYMLEENCHAGIDRHVWQNAQAIDFEGIPVLGLSPTDLMINICTHAARWEHVRSVKWVADSILVLRDSDIDWNRLVDDVRQRDLVLPMRETLGYLHHYFDMPVPILDKLNQVPVSRREKHEYEIKGRRRTYWRRLRFHWFNYLRLRDVIGKRNPIIGFQDYLKRRWGIPSLWHMPQFVSHEMSTRLFTGSSNITPDDPLHQLARRLKS